MRELVAAERSPTRPRSTPRPRQQRRGRTGGAASPHQRRADHRRPARSRASGSPRRPTTAPGSPTARSGTRASARSAPRIDEGAQIHPARAGRAASSSIDIHDHLRQELAQVRDLIDQVEAGMIGHRRGALGDQRDDVAAEQLDARHLLRVLLPAGHHPPHHRGPVDAAQPAPGRRPARPGDPAPGGRAQGHPRGDRERRPGAGRAGRRRGRPQGPARRGRPAHRHAAVAPVL